MNDNDSDRKPSAQAGEEYYVLSNEEAQREYLQNRRAAQWIPFLIPHLKPGMAVLDVGCGYGSITVDVAELVAPGQVTGVDLDRLQINEAQALADRRGIDNVSFQTGSVYELDFPDESFDVVLAHALLQHLSDRLGAVREMKRVLKPTGMLAVADDDYSSLVISPDDAPPREGLVLVERVMARNGGDIRFSRHVRRLLLDAGFAETEGHAVAAEYYGNLKETRRAASVMTNVLSSPEFVRIVTGEGWITEEDLRALLQRVHEWAERPDAFIGMLYCAAVAWVNPREG